MLALASLLSCVAAKPTVQARDATCGINGYDKGTPASFYLSTAPADVTSSGCASLCGTQQGCVSFAYGGGNCLLYAAPVVGNINISPDSPYVFNDLACVSGAVTTGSPSSSSTTPVAATTGDVHASSTGDSQACVATTVTVPGSQLPGSTSTTTVTQTPPAVQVTVATTTTTTLPASTVTQTLPVGTVTQTLPAVTKSATVTQTLPAVTATTTLTLPAVTKSATVTLPAVTSTKTVTVKCAAFGILCATST